MHTCNKSSQASVLKSSTMPSAVDAAKRELVKLLKSLADKYKVRLNLSRDSLEKDVSKAFKTVALRVHPDKGGQQLDFQNLSAANDAWQELLKSKGARGRPPAETKAPRRGIARACVVAAPAERQEFRVHSRAVLLTYQGFPADLTTFLDVWVSFLAFVQSRLRQWSVAQWTATAETNESDKHHLHLMLLFTKQLDRSSSTFAFQGVLPNVRANDLLGDGFGGRKFQLSVDRGHFYVWANKRGTVVDGSGKLCRAGNCEPAWARDLGSDLRSVAQVVNRYRVSGDWPRKLWQEYKLADNVFEEYAYLSKDKLAANKRSFEVYRQWKQTRDLEERVKERTKRIRGNPELYSPFNRVPEAEQWLSLFLVDALRYSVLVVHAPSYAGKSEWAVSLFRNPLYVEIGSSGMWPAAMKKLDRDLHDGVVLDDLRDLDFIARNQETLQGKYNRLVELFNTPGGELAVTLDLFRLPMVFTVNDSTANLTYLETHDFCKRTENVRLLCFSGRPGDCVPSDTLPRNHHTTA